jgi:hypothetical protein
VLVPLPVHYIAIFVLVFDLLKFVYADPCPSDSCLARSRQRPSLPIQPCRIQRGGLSPLLKHEATALERLDDGAPPLRLGDEARVDVGGRVGLNDDAVQTRTVARKRLALPLARATSARVPRSPCDWMSHTLMRMQWCGRRACRLWTCRVRRHLQRKHGLFPFS